MFRLKAESTTCLCPATRRRSIALWGVRRRHEKQFATRDGARLRASRYGERGPRTSVERPEGLGYAAQKALDLALRGPGCLGVGRAQGVVQRPVGITTGLEDQSIG